jgi:hypothetical protein
VVDADEPGQLDRGGDLLHALSRGGIPRILVVVHESARQAPQAATRLDGPAAKQHAAIDVDHYGGRDLWVVPEHEIIIGAGFDLAALDHSSDQLRPAEQTEMGHHSNCRSGDGRTVTSPRSPGEDGHASAWPVGA